MTPEQLRARLDQLLGLPAETEWVEFKHNWDEPNEIGQYLSALSNAAALHQQRHAYMVWGVDDKTQTVAGTKFKPHQTNGKGSEKLEPWLARLLEPRIDFRIFEFDYDNLPVVLFEIQAANNTPIAFSGQEWIRVGSHKKPLRDYPEKERKLWYMLTEAARDWSAQLCPGATLQDLDPQAVAFARAEYRKKHPNLAAEVDAWNDVTFLNKAKVCINGNVTRTAIILLGRNEAEHFLTPAIARITWVLKDEAGLEKDYQHFGPPLILAVNRVFSRIRNLTYRYLPDESLFPTEISQYDPWVIRETLQNSIAHQDYSLGGKINVVEEDFNSLLFTNLGEFLPGSVGNVIRRDAPPELYPNRFLAEAMVSLNMIDTIGSGIKRMFAHQRQRLFPMPDYDLSEPQRVKVRIPGKVIDEKYTRMLKARPDLDLLDVIALDKVQKKQPLSDEEFNSLKAKRLIEGRRPNLFVSASVAAATDTLVDYLKKRGIDKAYCRQMVIELLQKQGEAVKQDFISLLFSKVSDALDEGQKRNFITNLLQEMRRKGEIEVEGKGVGSKWKLCK